LLTLCDQHAITEVYVPTYCGSSEYPQFSNWTVCFCT